MSLTRAVGRAVDVAAMPTLARPLGFETLERRQLLAATAIHGPRRGLDGHGDVSTADRRRRGRQLDRDARVSTRCAAFDTFTYTHPTDVTIDRIRVAFTNDGLTPAAPIEICTSTASRSAA